jgi:hypothetical protein
MIKASDYYQGLLGSLSGINDCVVSQRIETEKLNEVSQNVLLLLPDRV